MKIEIKFAVTSRCAVARAAGPYRIALASESLPESERRRRGDTSAQASESELARASVSQGTLRVRVSLALAVGTSVVHTVTVTVHRDVGRACGLYIWRLFLSGQFQVLCSLHAEKTRTRRLGPKAAARPVSA